MGFGLPWRRSVNGLNLALRVTPRGGRDGIDGIEQLADGRSVVKLRVRATAADGEANKAVIALLSDLLDVPRGRIHLVSGATSRRKQVAIDGDPQRLEEHLQRLTAAQPADH